jgi:hypothetical protein
MCVPERRWSVAEGDLGAFGSAAQSLPEPEVRSLLMELWSAEWFSSVVIAVRRVPAATRSGLVTYRGVAAGQWPRYQRDLGVPLCNEDPGGSDGCGSAASLLLLVRV